MLTSLFSTEPYRQNLKIGDEGYKIFYAIVNDKFYNSPLGPYFDKYGPFNFFENEYEKRWRSSSGFYYGAEWDIEDEILILKEIYIRDNNFNYVSRKEEIFNSNKKKIVAKWFSGILIINKLSSFDGNLILKVENGKITETEEFSCSVWELMEKRFNFGTTADLGDLYLDDFLDNLE